MNCTCFVRLARGLSSLQPLSLCLRQSDFEEDKTGETYRTVQPERATAAQRGIERGEGERKRGATGPEGKRACGHGHAAHPRGEYLGEQHPRHRAERHGIAGYRRHHEHHHEEARNVQMVARAEDEVDRCQCARPEEHQRTAAPTVDSVYGHDGEDDVGHARDDDVEEHVANTVAGGGEYLLRIVEYHVRAAPLLEDGYKYAEHKHRRITAGE